ncbi:MAG: amidase family protein [Rhodomicrobium sp.]
MNEPCDLSAVEARRLIGRKELSPVELLESCLVRIENTNPTVNALVTLDVANARCQAKAVEAKVLSGEELGLLAGLPIAVKDTQATAGLRTTYGSLLYRDHVPAEDEGSVANIRRAGGIILAKTNTPEFGAGGNTTNRLFGPTGNPYDTTKTSGGSSGGSAAALALRQVPLATGSDYGGSLRTPAAFCGVVGFRPSPGLVPSGNGTPALLPFKVIGPIARTIEDAHLLLKAQMGRHRYGPFSESNKGQVPELLIDVDLSRIRIAISSDLDCAEVDDGIEAIFRERIRQFGHLFREVQERDPDMTGVHETFESLRGLCYVAAHGHRLEKHRELLGANVIDNVQRGLRLQVTDIAQAHVLQTSIAKKFAEFFQDADVLICPAASVSPFPHGQLFVEKINAKNMPTYMRWLGIAYAPTMALACAAVLPCGRDHNGMPFGIQVIAPTGADATVLEVSHAIEQVLRCTPANPIRS